MRKKYLLALFTVFMIILSSCSFNQEYQKEVPKNNNLQNNNIKTEKNIETNTGEVKIVDVASISNTGITVNFQNYVNEDLGVNFDLPIEDFRIIKVMPRSILLESITTIDMDSKEHKMLGGAYFRISNKNGKKVIFTQYLIGISEKKYSEYKNDGDLVMVKEYNYNGKLVKKIDYPAMIGSYEVVIKNPHNDTGISLLYNDNTISLNDNGKKIEAIIDRFINSVKFLDIASNNNDDYNIINKYYGYISKKDYENAYNLKYESGYNLDKFKKLYSDVKEIPMTLTNNYFYDIKSIGKNEYSFKIMLNLNNWKNELYSVQMKIVNGKLKTISSTKIDD